MREESFERDHPFSQAIQNMVAAWPEHWQNLYKNRVAELEKAGVHPDNARLNAYHACVESRKAANDDAPGGDND